MFPNEAGILVQQCWEAIPKHFPSVILDEFVVMPNHVHGIIVMGDNNVGAENVGANNHLPLQPNGGDGIRQMAGADNVGANNHLPLQVKPGTARTLGSVVRGFKIGVTKWFRAHTEIHSVWQRNYYEHIIRNETAYLKIADYIQTNPYRWEDDTYHV
ncbi:transposase [Thiothrix eikelboomii]|uniref:transposase n=1 Tax=Thiothrix eikelboomii TaxID=92487 RepID=UPI003BAEAD3A